MEIAFIVGLCLSGLFCYSVCTKSQKLIDRLTDKIIAERNPSAFATYATTTPTAKEDHFRPEHTPRNGKGNNGGFAETDLPSYLEIP
jgi:hypothetical protein